jgi:hypothetical protein
VDRRSALTAVISVWLRDVLQWVIVHNSLLSIGSAVLFVMLVRSLHFPVFASPLVREPDPVAD